MSKERRGITGAFVMLRISLSTFVSISYPRWVDAQLVIRNRPSRRPEQVESESLYSFDCEARNEQRAWRRRTWAECFVRNWSVLACVPAHGAFVARTLTYSLIWACILSARRARAVNVNFGTSYSPRKRSRCVLVCDVGHKWTLRKHSRVLCYNSMSMRKNSQRCREKYER